jgi:hypothetical protein
MDEQTAGHNNERVHVEDELGHHTEVPDTAPERPEQLLLVRVASSNDRARRGDEFRLNEVVERHAIQAGEMADAARQGQTADTSVTICAAGHRQLEPLRTRIDVVPACASLYRRGAGARINRDLPQQPEVDHQAALADGMTGHAVTATPHRDRKSVVHSKLDSCHNIRSVHRSDDDKRASIRQRIERLPRRVEPPIHRPDDGGRGSAAE